MGSCCTSPSNVKTAMPVSVECLAEGAELDVGLPDVPPLKGIAKPPPIMSAVGAEGDVGVPDLPSLQGLAKPPPIMSAVGTTSVGDAGVADLPPLKSLAKPTPIESAVGAAEGDVGVPDLPPLKLAKPLPIMSVVGTTTTTTTAVDVDDVGVADLLPPLKSLAKSPPIMSAVGAEAAEGDVGVADLRPEESREDPPDDRGTGCCPCSPTSSAPDAEAKRSEAGGTHESTSDGGVSDDASRSDFISGTPPLLPLDLLDFGGALNVTMLDNGGMDIFRVDTCEHVVTAMPGEDGSVAVPSSRLSATMSEMEIRRCMKQLRRQLIHRRLGLLGKQRKPGTDIKVSFRLGACSVVVPGELFVGTRRYTPSDISENRIRTIVNLSSFSGEHKYPELLGMLPYELKTIEVLNLSDHSLVSLMPHFVLQMIAAPKPIFVHCGSGVSRSTSMCIGYLMGTRGWSFVRGFRCVLKGRGLAHPSWEFVKGLLRYEPVSKHEKGEGEPKAVEPPKQSVTPPPPTVVSQKMPLRFAGSNQDNPSPPPLNFDGSLSVTMLDNRGVDIFRMETCEHVVTALPAEDEGTVQVPSSRLSVTMSEVEIRPRMMRLRKQLTLGHPDGPGLLGKQYKQRKPGSVHVSFRHGACSVVVPEELFVGSRRYTPSDISENRIRTIVNLSGLSGEHKYAELLGMAYELKTIEVLNLSDHSSVDLMPYLEDLIPQMIDAPKPIFVHCAAGVSRSTSLCIGYLMRTRGWGFVRGFRCVLRGRGLAYPNWGFVKALLRYEEALFKQKNEKGEAEGEEAVAEAEAAGLKKKEAARFKKPAEEAEEEAAAVAAKKAAEERRRSARRRRRRRRQLRQLRKQRQRLRR